MIKKLFVSFLALLCWISPSFAQDFSFALFTDTHISKNNNKPSEDLQLVINDANQNSAIEFVLVSGDLSEEGDYTSLTMAKKLLDQLKMPYHAVLGNHETKWTESGMTDFGKIFGSETFKFKHKGFLFLGFNTGPLLRMADGHVVPQVIDWLKSELEAAGKDQPTFLVTHYPLKEGDVDNWYDVTDAVRPYNIKAFLGGHYHSNRAYHYDGIPGFLNRSTMADKTREPGYTLYEVKGDSLFISEKVVGKAPKQWASLSLTEKQYAEEGSKTKYPDYSVNETYKNVERVWINQTGVGIYSSPLFYKKRIYVGDDMGNLTAYQAATGKKLWNFKANHRILGTPDVKEDVVVFGSADEKIYGLHARTGKLLWTVQAEAPVLGAVTIDHGKAYIGASDGIFRAIDIHTGKLLWSYEKVKGYVETKPLVTKDLVLFGAWDNTLYALNKDTGAEAWLWNGGIRGMHFSPAAVWPVAAHGKVFITDPKRAMTAIDIHTGETVWRTQQAMVRETIGLSEDHKRIYSKTMNDSIVCFSAKSNTPKQLWATNVGFGYEHAPSMQVEKEGIMYGSTKNGLIFALDGKTGKLLWKHKVGNSLISTVVPIGKNRVYFTATGGEVGLLQWNKNKK